MQCQCIATKTAVTLNQGQFGNDRFFQRLLWLDQYPLETAVGLVRPLFRQSFSSFHMWFRCCFFYSSTCELEIIRDGLRCNKTLLSRGHIYLLVRENICLLIKYYIGYVHHCIWRALEGNCRKLIYILVNVYFHQTWQQTHWQKYIHVHSSSGRNSVKNWAKLNQLTFTVLPSELLTETTYLGAHMAESQTHLTCAFHVFGKIRVRFWNAMSILKMNCNFSACKATLQKKK